MAKKEKSAPAKAAAKASSAGAAKATSKAAKSAPVLSEAGQAYLGKLKAAGTDRDAVARVAAAMKSDKTLKAADVKLVANSYAGAGVKATSAAAAFGRISSRSLEVLRTAGNVAIASKARPWAMALMALGGAAAALTATPGKSGSAMADDGKAAKAAPVPANGLSGINADYSTWAGGTTPKAAAHMGALDSIIYQNNLRRAAAKGDAAAGVVADVNAAKAAPANTAAPKVSDDAMAKAFGVVTGMSLAASALSLVMRSPKAAVFNAASALVNGQIAGAYLNSAAKAKAAGSGAEKVSSGSGSGRNATQPQGPASRSSYTTLDGRTVEATDKQSKVWGARRSQ